MAAQRTHHVFLVPGLFGFGKLAGYDYFEHIERALALRFADAGVPLQTHVVSTPPTASIPLRATNLAKCLTHTPRGASDVIHILGHSTGGLDARLLVAPGIRLPVAREAHKWLHAVRSVVTINTPHYGTPLAGYFTTVAGTRMLYLLSLLTVASLSIGRLPLSAVSAFLGAVGNLDERLGFQIKMLDDLTAQLLRFVGEEGRSQIRDYLSLVKHDRGGIMQLMPEVMELFNATVLDNGAVRYGCVATASPAPGPRRVLDTLGSPLGAVHLAIYTTVYGFASRAAARYPYAVPAAEQAARIARAFPAGVGDASVDGIVPTLSMLWGELLWCGAADHLDIVGHFGDFEQRPRTHVDWLRSGAHFRRPDFASLNDAIAQFMLRE